MLKKVLDKLKGGKTVYYPGCLLRFEGKRFEKNYQDILASIGIKTVTLQRPLCCGSPVLSAGYREEYDDLVRKNKEMFREYGVTRLITSCPGCFRTFSREYDIQGVEHITMILAENLDKIQKGRYKGERIIYHDPCHLGRLGGIFDQPRAVLQHLGFVVVEMRNSHERSLCCGGGGGVSANAPDLALKIAKVRLKQCTENTLVTSCALCALQFRKAAKGTGIRILEFSEVIL